MFMSFLYCRFSFRSYLRADKVLLRLHPVQLIRGWRGVCVHTIHTVYVRVRVRVRVCVCEGHWE